MVHKLFITTALLLVTALLLLFLYSPACIQTTQHIMITAPRIAPAKGWTDMDSNNNSINYNDNSDSYNRDKHIIESIETTTTSQNHTVRTLVTKLVTNLITKLVTKSEESPFIPNSSLPSSQTETTETIEDVDVDSWEDYSDSSDSLGDDSEDPSDGPDGPEGPERRKNKKNDYKSWKYLNTPPSKVLEPLGDELQELLSKERVLHTFNKSLPLLSMPKLPFLPNYRNPCWYEAVNGSYSYDEGQYTSTSRMRRRGPVTSSFYHEAKNRFDSRGWRLRCLPYFLLLGMPKCGTTDLFFKLAKHQSISTTMQKEPHWWTRKSYMNVTFEEYIDMYDLDAEVILRNISKSPHPLPYHTAITGDGSASTLWDTRELWQTMPVNQSRPSYHTAHLIQHIIPHAKFIIILRNPTTRLFSDYVYFHQSPGVLSPEDFHSRVQASVLVMNHCLDNHSVLECAHQYKKHEVPHELRQHICDYNGLYCGKNTKLPRLAIGMYSVFLREWLEVFPLRQFHIVTLEEYSDNRTGTLNNIADFLQLEPYLPHITKEIEQSSKENVTKRKKQEMLPETKEVLDEFYRPFNKDLALLLNDGRYLTW